ncbi:MAG: glycosyl transferase family 90 [Prevotella sp.]
MRKKIRKWWYTYIRHTRKNGHLSFFITSILRYVYPKQLLRKRLKGILMSFNRLPSAEKEYIRDRVDYYCKFNDMIALPDDAPPLSNFTYRKRESYVHDYVNSTYFFDAYEYTRFFPENMRWAYITGDVNTVMPLPEITKSRPLMEGDANRNNILLNLDKVRHFTWVCDPFSWEEKECRILFRGDARDKPRRLKFIEMWKDHPYCDLVSTGKMSLYDHLYYRYIMALEGNDVASNLKWVMSSNSIAVMPRPTCETWYMEGRLIPNYHYIEIASDYHDLIERIEYYEAHPEEAKAIVEHAHEWVKQFRNKKRERLISLMVLDKYFKLTGQKQ